MKENGKTVRCPKCGSDKVVAVLPFDYVKMCENPWCPYRSEPEAMQNNWKYQWSTGVSN